MPTTPEHRKEAHLRRLAASQGLRLVKSRRQAVGWGGFMLTDPSASNVVVLGGEPPYSAELDTVADYLDE